MNNKFKKKIFAAGSTFLLAFSSAHADALNAFESLEGKYKGSGTALMEAGGKKVRVSCSLTNTVDGSKLKVRGKCASSQGARRISGSLSGNGNSVSGNFLGATGTAKMVGSSGSVKGKTMTIVSSFVDETKGERIKVRQIIRVAGSGFKAEFYTLNSDSKRYEAAGSISFKKKK